MLDQVFHLLARHVEVIGALPDLGRTLVLPHRFVDPMQHAQVVIKDLEHRLFEEGTRGWVELLQVERGGLHQLETGLSRMALFTDVGRLGVGSLLHVKLVKTDLSSIVPAYDELAELVDQLTRRRQLASWLTRTNEFPDRLSWPHVYFNEIIKRTRGIKPLNLLATASIVSAFLFILPGVLRDQSYLS